MLLRQRVVQRLAVPARVTLVVGSAGYGKTVAVQQWVDGDVRLCSWITLSLIDQEPAGFWRGVIGAMRVLRPEIDDQPDALLDRHGPGDARFLAALVAQAGASCTPGVLVIDEVSRLTDPTALAGLALMIERLGPEIQVVLIGRNEPALPIARWRSQGLLGEVNQEQLRFTPSESIAAVAALSDVHLSVPAIVEMSDRLEGWPAGLHLALLAIRDDPDPVAAAARVAGSGRLFSSYLVSEVLEQLPDDELQVALALSVVDEFDAELCRELLGAEWVPVARALLRRSLFLTRVDGSDTLLRFHPLFLEVLREELSWRDPARRVVLHRRAAELCRDRGDLNGAYLHLALIPDRGAASELLLDPMVAMGVAGDRRGVARLMRSLPPSLEVDSADLALDLAAGWMMVGDRDRALHWCDRADELALPGNDWATARSLVLRCSVAFWVGDLDRALEHVERFGCVDRSVAEVMRFDHFAAIAARVMLAAGRLDDAADWAEHLRGSEGTGAWVADIVPAIDAWVAWERGELGRAGELAEQAVARLTAAGRGASHAAFDAKVIAAWCRLGAGDLLGAQGLVDALGRDARSFQTPWHHLRAGVLHAEVGRLIRGPRAALDSIGELRRVPGLEGASYPFLRRELDFAEAAALIQLGAVAPATRLVDAHPDSTRKRLLLARAASRYETVTTVEEILGVRAGWPVPAQLEADLLVARAGSSTDCRLLTATLAAGRSSGWVLPFLGHGQAVDDFVAGHALAQLHPKLHAVLAQRREGTVPTALHIELTPRELTVLRLLSTHLSYAEIAARLYLSVNTVKTNLKSLYRKLGVASRSEAVDAATRAGIS